VCFSIPMSATHPCTPLERGKDSMSKQYTIGIDIGGTKMAAVLFNGKRVVADSYLATPKDSLNHFLVMLYALIQPLEEKAKKDGVEITGVGLGVPAPLDLKREKILFAPNLPILNGVKLAKKLSEKIGKPVVMDNDASCFIRGEAIMGAGRKYKNVFGVTLGTGIGGAWWIDGNSYTTTHAGACEISESVVDYSNGSLLEEVYHRLTQNNPANLAEDAYRGDVLAEKAFQEVGKYLGITLANIVNLIAPEVIVVGGSVVNSGDLFWSSIYKSLTESIRSPEIRKNIRLEKSALGKDAGAIGAALLTGQQ